MFSNSSMSTPRVVELPFGDTSLTLSFDVLAIVELSVLGATGMMLYVLAGLVAYVLIRRYFLSPVGRLATVLAIAVAASLVPCAFLYFHGPCRTRVANFTISSVCVGGFFRLVELACQTGPKGFDRSLRNYLFYLSVPVELAFDGEGRPRQAPKGLVLELISQLVLECTALYLAVCLGRSTEFLPFLSSGATAVPALALNPSLLPAVYLQTFTLCMLLTVNFSSGRLLLALLGIDSQVGMRSPMFCSTSVREFWGRRWNLLIHGLMKRTFFKPLLHKAAALRHAGALAAFAVSGLFHEYQWWLTSWGTGAYTFGGPLLFFAAQFALTGAEALLAKSVLGSRVAALPGPLKTALTSLAILPFGPLFLRGLHGFLMDLTLVMPAVTLTQTSSAF